MDVENGNKYEEMRLVMESYSEENESDKEEKEKEEAEKSAEEVKSNEHENKEENAEPSAYDIRGTKLAAFLEKIKSNDPKAIQEAVAYTVETYFKQEIKNYIEKKLAPVLFEQPNKKASEFKNLCRHAKNMNSDIDIQSETLTIKVLGSNNIALSFLEHFSPIESKMLKKVRNIEQKNKKLDVEDVFLLKIS